MEYLRERRNCSKDCRCRRDPCRANSLIIVGGWRKYPGEAPQSSYLSQTRCTSDSLEPARELGRSCGRTDLELGILAERLLVPHKLLVLLPPEISVRRTQARDAIFNGGYKLVLGLPSKFSNPHRLNEDSARVLIGSLLKHRPSHADLF